MLSKLPVKSIQWRDGGYMSVWALIIIAMIHCVGWKRHMERISHRNKVTQEKKFVTKTGHTVFGKVIII